MYINYRDKYNSCHVYVLHHSAKYRFACLSTEAVYKKYALLSIHMKLTPLLGSVKTFLGVEWERIINMNDGVQSELGNLWLVRQRANIEKMVVVALHGHTNSVFNPRRLVRTQALPSNGDDRGDKIPLAIRKLPTAYKAIEYQSLTGSMNFIMRTRPAIKYEIRELAAYNHCPRVWDWERAVWWFMDILKWFLVETSLTRTRSMTVVLALWTSITLCMAALRLSDPERELMMIRVLKP